MAHPALERSRVNRRLFAAIRDLSDITTHDLYETYPDFSINVRAEQARLAEHDVIVLQHPFYWYSAPSLLKEWLDLVLELGWAYGPGGNALAGKIIFNAITTGGNYNSYRADGTNRFTIRQLLAPFDQTASLCGMRYLAPLVIHGALSLTTDAAVIPSIERYTRILSALREGTLNLDQASRTEYLFDALDNKLTPRASS